MYRQRIKKYAFTLAETVIVCSVFAVMVVWIILMINRAYEFMDNTRVAVMATNFAREWVEMVYNIRDTNWRKYSWMKDAKWATGFSDLHSSLYYLKEQNWKFSLIKLGLSDDGGVCGVDKFYESAESFFEALNNDREVRCADGFFDWLGVVYSWTYSYYSWGVLVNGEIWDLFKNGIEFYRVVFVYWFFDKISWNRIGELPSPHPEKLTDWSPVEAPFCVVVYYRNRWKVHKTELCSVLTNFME